jgi:hypothetical protein
MPEQTDNRQQHWLFRFAGFGFVGFIYQWAGIATPSQIICSALAALVFISGYSHEPIVPRTLRPLWLERIGSIAIVVVAILTVTYRLIWPVEPPDFPTPPPALQMLYRASDGTAYQVVSLARSDLQSGAEALRVTTIAAAPAGLSPATYDLGGLYGDAISAAAGAAWPGQTLFPFNQIWRTAILHAEDLSQHFDPAGEGTLRIGAGAKAIVVRRSDSLRTITDDDGEIRGACIATDLVGVQSKAQIELTAFVFGLPSTGYPPLCKSSPSATVATTVCAPIPADGFSLTANSAIVFVYGGPSFARIPVTVGVGGFFIDQDGRNTRGCPRDRVVGVLAVQSSEPAWATPDEQPNSSEQPQ